MIPTLIGMLNLFLRLWWLWLIVIGPVLFFSRRSLKWLVLAAVLIVTGTLYLVLTLLEGLQIVLPAYVAVPPPQQFGPTGGMPVADTFEWNLLPGFYDAVNHFFIPLFKQFWYIWIPGWFLILTVAALNPERRMTQ